MAKAQGTMAGAAKDSKNPHFNSKYADLASIVDACREALAANGVAVFQSPSADANLIKMKTLLVHGSGEWIESDELTVQARDAAPQAVGSCLTYLRRYQLASMVGVAPADDDAEAAEGRPMIGTMAQVGKSVSNTFPLPPGKPSGYDKLTQKPNGKFGVPTKVSTPPEPPPLTDKDIPF